MKRIPAILLAISIAASAAATTMRRYTLLEVRDAAETVFIGVPASSSTRLVGDGKIVVTDYVVNVKEVLNGTVGATTNGATTITFPGGTFGEKKMAVSGAPSLELGKTYVFFRTRQPNNTTVGWSQGLFRVESARVGGTVRPVLLSTEGEALVLTNGKLSLGARSEIRGGELVRSLSATTDAEPRDGVGKPTNADGTPARRLQAAPAVAANAVESIATLDDLRTFVRAGIRK
jgi:hypothetical protein